MSAIPQYIGCFTLLYADPEVKEQRQYLQPLYGLTADDDPPAPQQHQRASSQEGSASTSGNSSSRISQDDAQGRIAGSQRSASLDEPTTQRHKYPQAATNGVLPRLSNPTGAKVDDREGSPAPTAAPSTARARPPRKVDHVGLGLYPDLSTGIVGPQPVFGGAAISAATAAAPTTTSSSSSAAASTGAPQTYLFASNGAPMLSSVVDVGALHQLQDARRPYPAPQPRSGHVLLSCPERGSLILFGGLGDVPFNDVWEYDVRTGRWAELPCVPATDDDEEEVVGQQQKLRWSHAQRSGSPDLDEGAVACVSSSSVTSSDDEDDAIDDDDNGTRSATLRRRRRRQRRNMPPPAYGQAAALYQDANGETCMAVLGGISVGDICCSGFFSLNLHRRTWRRVETTIPFFDMWGATAQTLYAPRRSSAPHAAVVNEACSGGSGSGPHVDAEEQVVVLFGGMTEEGEVVRPVTHLFHFDHRLTAAEVDANAELYLESIEYGVTEHRRILRHVLAEGGVAEDHETGDNGQSPCIEARCSQWREEHADTLAQWRRHALKKMVGKYWAEHLPAPEDLHGRRRSTSAAYKRHFMFIFGGRDDFYFYNDLWCLNLVTRTWVQVREGVPPHWLRSFLAEPHNPMCGILISDRVAQLRQETVLKTEAKLMHNSPNGTVNPMFRIRDVHHALFASSSNSSARARTGACMVADVQRDCLYVYGGFSYTGQQHLTFFDLHAFYIGENIWRRVCVCRERPWEAVIDAAADAVSIVHPAEEGRSYARHASPPSTASGSGASPLPLTLMGYATRYLSGGSSSPTSVGATSVAALLGPPLAPRGSRASRMPSTPSSPGGYSNCFHLPVFLPEARTMAAMAGDPLQPGARFFLHGGRCGEEACGDFFELRTHVSRAVDMEYMKLHRAAREEDAAGSSPRRSLAGLDTLATPSASPSSPPAASMLTHSLVAADAASAQAAGLPAADAARLQWNSRRQLQRKLVSAAIEAQEGFEDKPAALYSSANDTVPLPRRTLRAAATRWIRDILASVDPQSLMFVELRNGHAMVNMRTHIHYRSRLSMLSGDGSGASESCEKGSTVTRSAAGSSRTLFSANRTSSSRTDTVAGIVDSASASPALTTLIRLESMDGHLKRSARSMELLLYDVLLSKLASSGGGGGNAANAALHRRSCSSAHMPGKELMTSPCTRDITTATSPEAHRMFPSHPANLAGGHPGSSTGEGTPPSTSPQIQILSRAQHSTPRTPHSLSTTLSVSNDGTTQEELSVSFPSQASEPTAVSVNGARALSPSLEGRSSSFLGGCSGSGAGATFCGSVSGSAPPDNNEYAYHALLRSLFYREPFHKANYSMDKKR
ncbi:hypothetical protein LSCM1_06900 [Leishmania martiniquensis]|uniref:Galactose oxidase, central domain family protein n=1 Tax=Leishmania martiniquensis TaxID=1580590 RepID=A0A836HK88_9TRYP|nr:hypothetical protein LSCM1_06900 [Leishmania martiniquensis]